MESELAFPPNSSHGSGSGGWAQCRSRSTLGTAPCPDTCSVEAQQALLGQAVLSVPLPTSTIFPHPLLRTPPTDIVFLLLLLLFFYILFYFVTLQYYIGFAIYQHESATGIHVFPILNPPPSLYHPSGLSQCTSPKHPVSCIKPRLATRLIYDIIHVSMPFCQIIPPSPSPTESKRLFYTSVSLLLARIQGYCYHLSKFHIYVLVYCIGVFLSGLLHSV